MKTSVALNGKLLLIIIFDALSILITGTPFIGVDEPTLSKIRFLASDILKEEPTVAFTFTSWNSISDAVITVKPSLPSILILEKEMF
ncbi:hypothetical protein D3C85_535050 [compost metagenome]